MTPDLPTARLEISLPALLANYRALQARAPVSEVAPVVKADAYGLGMADIAPYLSHFGAKTFFVARLDEGIALRKILPKDRIIYVLDGLGFGQVPIFKSLNLRPVLNSATQYQQWIDSDIDAALHVDTGMNRLGVRPEEIAGLPKSPRALSLIVSHLACGDEPNHPLNAQQLTAFHAVTNYFPVRPDLYPTPPAISSVTTICSMSRDRVLAFTEAGRSVRRTPISNRSLR